jgi:hypothetical protein
MKKAYFAAKDAYTPSRPPGSGTTSSGGTRPYTPPGRAAIPTFGGKSTMYPEGRLPAPSGGGRPTPPSGETPPPPSGGGERLVGGKTIDQRIADAKKLLAGRRAAARPGMPKPDTNFGRNLKGGIIGAAVGHMLEDAGNVGTSLMAGDFQGAKKAGFDILSHDPVLGRNVAGVAKMLGQRGYGDGFVDKFIHDNFMNDRPAPKPAAALKQEENPASIKPITVGQKPLNPAPDGPSSIADIGRQGRGQSKALRDPESYLGSAFDATLRKGISTGRNYLQNQMNKDGLDSDMQSKIMARYNDKIAGDKELSKKENEGGVINTIKAKDEARAGRTLEAYRGQRGEYKGNTSYADMQKKYVK